MCVPCLLPFPRLSDSEPAEKKGMLEGRQCEQAGVQAAGKYVVAGRQGCPPSLLRCFLRARRIQTRGWRC